jgi:hypothetical protein
MSHSIESVSRDRDFERWVAQRLEGWPTGQILEFERWLLDEGAVDLLPALREVLWERSLDPGLTAA